MLSRTSTKHCITGAVLLLIMNAAYAAERLHLVERPLHEATTHIHGEEDSAGDLLTFANPVFDAANRTQVGSDHGYCVRIVPGKSWECLWTLKTQAGMLTVEGPLMDTGDSVFVVTGGSGKYTGAKGQMKLHARDAKPSGYDFVYELR